MMEKPTFRDVYELALRWENVHTDESYGASGKALGQLAREVLRLMQNPKKALSDHPGCGYCMSSDSPIKVGVGEVCPVCGDRLPTQEEYDHWKCIRPEAAFGKWLETAEGKPEFGQRVIAWDGDWKQPCIMEYMGGALWASRFTHWMHIPLAPQNGISTKEEK